MAKWKLDSRTRTDLIQDIREIAASYTPEWNFNPDDPDMGSALAFVYADMMEGTIRQLNRAGYKNELAFFNSLGAKQKGASPARGYVVFKLASGAPSGTEVDTGTAVTAEIPGDEGGNARFETQDDVYVTSSEPSCLYLTDGRKDAVWQVAEDVCAREKPYVLFRETGENLQEHTLCMTHRELLDIQGEAYVEVSFLAGKERLADRQVSEAFADPEVARFFYWSEQGWEEFDQVSFLQGRLLLHKKASQIPFSKIAIRGEETFAIQCRVSDIRRARRLSLEKILLQGRGDHLSPELVYGVTAEYGQEEYFPFGERMNPYSEVYFGCREALGKRGAQVSLSFQMDYVRIPMENMGEDNPIEWKWVMKRSEFRPDPEYDIVIQEVIWEYFNGTGWNRLFPGREYSDLFSAKTGVLNQQKKISFLCPSDMSPILVNSVETCYIRARILKMSNLYKAKGRFITPILSRTEFSYYYGEGRKEPEMIVSANNGNERFFAGQDKDALSAGFFPFVGVEEDVRTLYLGFDRPPTGAPVRMLLLMEDTLQGERGSLSWEYSAGRGWKELNLADETRNLSRSGLVTFVGQNDFSRVERFGREMYWIRIRDAGDFYGESIPGRRCPVLRSLWMNATRIRHTQREETEFFTLDYYEEDCELSLIHGNIDEIEVQVLEGPEEEAQWVIWEETENLHDQPRGSRVYQADRIHGTVTFGNGTYAMAPPFGRTDGIRVRYRCGGGAGYNVEAGQVSRLSQTRGFVSEVQNPEKLWGGLDVEEPREAMRRCAAGLRHRDRAVTARDYEELAREASRAIGRVRCFGGWNEDGEREPGAVTLVVLTEEGWKGSGLFHSIQEDIFRYLEPRMAPGILARRQFYVTEPKFVEVRVRAELMVKKFQDIFQVRRRAAEQIEAFLNAGKGHFDGDGWEIGRFPTVVQLQNVIKDIPGLVRIQKIYLMTFIIGDKGRREVDPDMIRRHPYVLPVSGEHEITVTAQEGISG